MKKLAATLLLLTSSTLVHAEPIHLGFSEPDAPPTMRVLPLTQVAVAGDPGSEMQPLPAEPPRAERTVFGLPKNVGTGDRILRTVVGAALLGTGIWGMVSDEHLSSTTSGILMGVSAVPFATAATGYCPLYQALGIDHSF
ncbi:MAG: DUF2892 domain-containing protein [Kofleriaceae bacterium]